MTPQSATPLPEIRAAMAATNALFNGEVLGKRNFGALDNVYTVDARIFPPGAPMVAGREGIRKFWTELVTGANATSCILESVDVMPAGGWSRSGRRRLPLSPSEEAPVTVEVKYVVYWRIENDRWKWHVDIWNPNA